MHKKLTTSALILICLYKNSGNKFDIYELARLTKRARGTVSQAVKTLVKKELIEIGEYVCGYGCYKLTDSGTEQAAMLIAEQKKEETLLNKYPEIKELFDNQNQQIKDIQEIINKQDTQIDRILNKLERVMNAWDTEELEIG